MKPKNIFQKYSDTHCNPDNKNIILLSEKCKFSDKITYGGFECGDNGKWSKKCVPSYCDMGYYFDIIQKKCVNDPCYSVYEEEEESKKEFWKKKKVFKVFFIAILTTFIMLSIILIYRCYLKDERYVNGNAILSLILIILFLIIIILFFLWIFKY